jgi:hypothetical protein
VERGFIAEQLKEISEGGLLLPEDVELESTAEILRSIRKTSDALERKRPVKKGAHKGGNRGGNKNYRRK